MRLSVNSQPPGSRDIMLCHVTVTFLVFLGILLDGTYGQGFQTGVTGGRICFYDTTLLKNDTLNLVDKGCGTFSMGIVPICK